jgi:hypothetical protein
MLDATYAVSHWLLDDVRQADDAWPTGKPPC